MSALCYRHDCIYIRFIDPKYPIIWFHSARKPVYTFSNKREREHKHTLVERVRIRVYTHVRVNLATVNVVDSHGRAATRFFAVLYFLAVSYF